MTIDRGTAVLLATGVVLISVGVVEAATLGPTLGTSNGSDPAEAFDVFDVAATPPAAVDGSAPPPRPTGLSLDGDAGSGRPVRLQGQPVATDVRAILEIPLDDAAASALDAARGATGAFVLGVELLEFSDSDGGVEGIAISHGVDAPRDDLLLTLVPEPATIGLAGLAGLTLVGGRRRRDAE